MEFGIIPEIDLHEALLHVEKPARYVGGEFGSVIKKGSLFDIAISFPDLYEIGMSNLALKILYNGLNRSEKIRCERVFAPAPDFEKVLKEKHLPLYTLESGRPISSFDLIGFSVGYELCSINILTILDLGGIPLFSADRGKKDPIVIAGGPAVSNPLPLSRFIDFAYIGEAEEGFFSLCEELAEMKASGAHKSDLMTRMDCEKTFWRPGKKAVRAVFRGFANTPSRSILPVASMKPVQDHGVVEIMRGCPNACRFCHAGYHYRPQRAKFTERIFDEVDMNIGIGGYQEISLSSLSSGDFEGISELITFLNEAYKGSHISFQLPSLRVSTFTLPLLEKISEVRKSGLTFAVETPRDSWQLSINKSVSMEKIIDILAAAKVRGWRLAKFYFMIGLPFSGNSDEEANEIAAFIIAARKRSGIHLNINVGTFIPKPHTPFQWCAQFDEISARASIDTIKRALKKIDVKLSYHDPFLSVLEGVIARGDGRVGELLYRAYTGGSRLDAWDEYIREDVWRVILESCEWPVLDEVLSNKALGAELPWDSIDIGVRKDFFQKEYLQASAPLDTVKCQEICAHNCGICDESNQVVLNSIHNNEFYTIKRKNILPCTSLNTQVLRVLFHYSKKGKAAYLSHLSLIEVFSKAFRRSGLPLYYTEGFNPQVRLEIASPLSVGIDAYEECGAIILTENIVPEVLSAALNNFFPKGISIDKILIWKIVEGVKQISISSVFWGARYGLDLADERQKTKLLDRLGEKYGSDVLSPSISEGGKHITVDIPFLGKKEYQFIPFIHDLSKEENLPTGNIIRKQIFARFPTGAHGSYIEVFKEIYLPYLQDLIYI